MDEYMLLKDVYWAAANGGLVSLRSCWEDVFTTHCSSHPGPCGTCRNCSIRIAQATIVVYAAQGVADENILPHLGSVYRHPKYQHFGVEEWAALPVEEIASVLRHCSMQGQNALYIHDFLKEVSNNGVPRTVDDCLSFYGMLKKTACLFLSVVFEEQFGIPVDRHLSTAFINLAWVPHDCRAVKMHSTLMSQMVEFWLPKEETGEINNVIAGLRQLYNNARYRNELVQVAARCGPKAALLLQKLTVDLTQRHCRSKKKS
jgi:endonuclease III